MTDEGRTGDTGDTVGTESSASTGDFPVAALGASAGGLKALEEFFSHVANDSGIAFVVVTHQHPTQTSLLAELLGRKTEMPVIEVSSELEIEPNHVYTAAPGHTLDIIGDTLYANRAGRSHLPIDHFFRSLALDRKDRAIGIILSGTGSDGSLGLAEIKGALGMVMVQEEASAQYGGMPHSAMATELVDYELPASELPAQLVAYVKGLNSPVSSAKRAGDEDVSEDLEEIFAFILEHTGQDFTQYKRSTVGRRIERRINVQHLDSLRSYVEYLRGNPAEVELLFRELLIGVTSFFRDHGAWKALAAKLSERLAAKLDDEVFRAWVPGCSTGEEAYSLAILLREAMDRREQSFRVQIFATDLDERAIDIARSGVYPPGIANDVSAKRLSRFFTRHDDTYRVKKEIREMVVFAPQNLIGDPPFTKLDMLSCRNLLIYLNSALQRRLLPIFHYSLKPGGLLFLGSSESIGTLGELFGVEDKKWKIFRRKEVVSGRYTAELPVTGRGFAERMMSIDKRSPIVKPTAAQLIDRALASELIPPTVLIRASGDVVYVHGRTGRFLEVAQGSQTAANIFNMARPGLELRLAAAVRQAAETDDEVVMRSVPVTADAGQIATDLRVKQLTEPRALAGLYRITFDHPRPLKPAEVAPPDRLHQERVTELERDLQYLKESRQGTIEELEAANEELKSTNEELQSTNEELQSANEELETSKEEMQSLNEELQTVNAELQGKVEELSRANDDMKNLLNGTDIATVFLDNRLRIKRFTAQAQKVIRVIDSDVGRPIGDLVSTLHYDRLNEDAGEVLRTLAFKEVELESDSGETYLLRILPYRTTDNVIDGLVLTFVDVSKLTALRAEQARLLDTLDHSPACVFAQDRRHRIVWGSGRLLGRAVSELTGRSDYELLNDESRAEFQAIKTGVLESGEARHSRVSLSRADGTCRWFQLFVEPRRVNGETIGFSTVGMELSEDKAP